MGLDMYLNARHYVGANYDHNNVQLHIDLQMGGKPYPIDVKNVTYIETQVGYWRKANQIHQWFVNNVQAGEDDCGSYDVDPDTLKSLFDLCKEIIQDQTKAEELLPTARGFFFGGEEYNEWYFQDIEETIKILKPLMKNNAFQGDLQYHSSW